MFFKRLFQCVRYSVSLYADCAVIYQGSRNSKGWWDYRPPPSAYSFTGKRKTYFRLGMIELHNLYPCKIESSLFDQSMFLEL